MSDNIMAVLFLVAFGFLGLLIILLIVLGVRTSYVDMKCAQQGYPKSKVTMDFAGYCMNLDGSVTIKMEKVKP